MSSGQRQISIEGLNPAEIYGINNANLKHIKSFFPKLQVIARGNQLNLAGDDEVMDEFERKFALIVQHYQTFNTLTENNIDNLMLQDGAKMLSQDDGSETLVHGNGGVKIKARTVNQKKLVQAVLESDMVFAVGPAGTGKTYTAVAMAVRALKAKEVKRIILTRPAVEAGENLGFLPGDLKEKLDPYLMPLYDALRDMIPAEKLADMIEFGVIEIAPLAFMRGRTLDKAFVILDEAQNTTQMQMKMFLTRMGMTAKFVITGDMSQVDLPSRQRSGLSYALDVLHDINEIKIVRLGQSDVIRHRLVKQIIEAFDVAEHQEKLAKQAKIDAQEKNKQKNS
ncbi:MAG: PhoH family protein [Crocinitomicaceae bacterium]|nr:PhoH family protein [Crocinitomicaceae bacterium]MDP4724438.1 PhoH family protein [Crocinitomicaceae bacterium]MDP4738645.1 PhoH family protein [Crocinitomicaceae bacterium]MDP4800056.1 PhoH family protein [Crocinitomicaceae bacterium]MDP4806482.1 PhoH family protein [Crocinitomicaceae bacterium]